MYEAEISRANPTCLVFLVDQSGSMADAAGGTNQRKCDVVADAINHLLQNFCIKCAKEEGVRDYFHVALIGYGATVGSAFRGPLAGRLLVPLSEVAESPADVLDRVKKIPDGAGGLIDQTVKFPVWIDPIANGGTPMTQGLTLAHGLVQEWVANHLSSYPPTVLQVTDGEPTDGDPRPAAQALTSLSTTDGNALLFNLHVSSQPAQSVFFPGSTAVLPDRYAGLLFEMTSQLPQGMRAYARQQEFMVLEDARGFMFNADAAHIVQFFDIGTRTTDLR